MLLQVLRLRDAPGPPLLARRGRGHPRRRLAPRCEGAARADRRAAGGQRRGGRAACRVRARGLHLVRGLGLRAGDGARDASPHEPGRALARGPRQAARGDCLAGTDARVDQPRPGGPPGIADQAPIGAPRHDSRGRRAAHPVHERDLGGDRRVARRADRGPRGARGAPRRARAPAGGHPAELRFASALLRRRAGADRRRGSARRARGRRGGAAACVGHADRARRHALAGTRVPAAHARRRAPDPAESLGLVAGAGR